MNTGALVSTICVLARENVDTDLCVCSLCMTHKILKFQFGRTFRDSGSAFASSLSRPNSIARNRNRRLIGEPERHFASRRSFSSAAALFFSHPWSSSRVYVSPIARSTAFPRPIAPRSRPVVAHHLVPDAAGAHRRVASLNPPLGPAARPPPPPAAAAPRPAPPPSRDFAPSLSPPPAGASAASRRRRPRRRARTRRLRRGLRGRGVQNRACDRARSARADGRRRRDERRQRRRGRLGGERRRARSFSFARCLRSARARRSASLTTVGSARARTRAFIRRLRSACHSSCLATCSSCANRNAHGSGWSLCHAHARAFGPGGSLAPPGVRSVATASRRGATRGSVDVGAFDGSLRAAGDSYVSASRSRRATRRAAPDRRELGLVAAPEVAEDALERVLVGRVRRVVDDAALEERVGPQLARRALGVPIGAPSRSRRAPSPGSSVSSSSGEASSSAPRPRPAC